MKRKIGTDYEASLQKYALQLAALVLLAVLLGIFGLGLVAVLIWMGVL